MSLSRQYLLVVVAVGLLAVAPRPTSAQMTEVIGVDQVIDGEELRRMGITRLGDVVRYLHAGRMMTIDGFSRRISMNGLGSFHETGPSLYVDGHPIDISILDTERLNLLGLPIEAIDRVELVTKPALIYGTFAGRGAIHVHTRPEVEGARIEAGVSAASEVGDPGPFAYRVDARNRDTQGLDGRGLVEVGGATGGARMAGVYHRHYLTKPHILERLLILQNLSDAPVISVGAPALTAAWGTETLGANVVGLGVYGKIYPYLPYAAREVSANYRAANLSAVVRHQVRERLALRHRITASALDADAPDDSNVPFGWEQERITLNSAFGRALERRVVVLGATGGLERVRAGDEIDLYTASLYAAIAGRMSGTVQYQGGGMLSTDWSQSALKAYGGITIRPSPTHRGDIYVSISEELPHEQDPVDAWARLGVDVPLLADEFDRPDENVSTRATGDVEWSWTPNDKHELAAGAGMRTSVEAHVYRREIRRLGAGYNTTAISFGNAAGTNGIVWMEYAARLLPGRQRMFWHIETTLAGDERFREIWRAVPDARLGLSVYLPIAPDFEIEASLIRQSGSTWAEFAPLTDADVPGATLLDLAFYKRILAGRVHLRFALRNLFRDDVQYHPIGDVFDLSAQIDLRMQFGKSR